MKQKCLILIFILLLPITAAAEQVFSVNLFFGLSRPDGTGVTLAQWQTFETQTLATTFPGFTVADTLGYYQGAPERSKLVLLVLKQDEIPKAEKVAAAYAEKFDQDSVMMVKTPVAEWKFITPETN